MLLPTDPASVACWFGNYRDQPHASCLTLPLSLSAGGGEAERETKRGS